VHELVSDSLCILPPNSCPSPSFHKTLSVCCQCSFESAASVCLASTFCLGKCTHEKLYDLAQMDALAAMDDCLGSNSDLDWVFLKLLLLFGFPRFGMSFGKQLSSESIQMCFSKCVKSDFPSSPPQLVSSVLLSLTSMCDRMHRNGMCLG
jgi:hypothetical protein